MRYALNPNHYLEALVGWNPDSVWFKTFAQGLENGERKMKRYMETSKQMLDEFVRTHKKWLETADGQGKDGIWYEVKVSPVAEWHKGDQPIFGEPVTVYMTPLQKVHMYLERSFIPRAIRRKLLRQTPFILRRRMFAASAPT